MANPASASRQTRKARRPVEGEFGARITLRLPDSIKDIVERAASDSGDSVNAWVVKTLAGTCLRLQVGPTPGIGDI